MRENSELFGKKLYLPVIVEEGFQTGGEETFAIYQRADGSREEYSYANLYDEGKALLERLDAMGLEKGDRIAIITALKPWWYSIYYAAVKAGYIMVCIDPGAPLPQIQNMLRETESHCVFVGVDNVRLPRELEGRIPVMDIAPGFPLKSECSKVDILLGPATPLSEEATFVIFSSGTTGERRKAVLLPGSSIADALEWNGSADSGVYKNIPAYTMHKRDLMLFPPYHIAGLMASTLDLYANTQVIMLEKLTPQMLGGVLQELKPDNVCTVPGMLTVLMKKIRATLAESPLKNAFVKAMMSVSGFLRRKFGWKIGFHLLRSVNRAALGGELRSFMIGASPCDADTMRFFLNMGIDVPLAYGLSELGAPLAVTGKGYYLNSTGRVNHYGEGMDIRIVNPDEQGRGEVEILSPFRMITYLNPEDMVGCFTEDGYFKTGDLGYFNGENCLVICGRAKEAIVLRNGEKLLPEEIEAQYKDIGYLSALAAFKVPGTGGCDAFSLAGVVQKESGLPDEVVRLHILERAAALPAMYRPQEVFMLRELPLSATRKVQRFRLTEMAVQGLKAPVTEASLRAVNEEGLAGELREILISVGGPQWKDMELTEGLLLDLDSLQSIELAVAVQEKFGIDLFQLTTPPETFGALLQAVSAFEEVEKTDKHDIDLSRYPESVSAAAHAVVDPLVKAIQAAWNVHAVGTENIPREGNFLICSNHITSLDPVWIGACMPLRYRRRTAIVGKSSLLESKVFKELVRTHNFIPVDRTGNSVATLDRCKELLDEGWNVEIFPEGTNFENAKELMSFKQGPARLAIAAGKPILPVHIKGLKHVENHKFLPPLGSRIEVVFGEVISSEGMEPAELTALLRETIQNL